MATRSEAVVAALRVALYEAEHSEEPQWETRAANRWVDLLPGASLGRWRHLKLADGLVSRTKFAGHVRATLAYLDALDQPAPARQHWWHPLRRTAKPTAPQPVVAKPAPSPRPVNLLRLRKPVAGVH